MAPPKNAAPPPPPLGLLDVLGNALKSAGAGLKKIVFREQTPITLKTPLGTVFSATVTTEVTFEGDPGTIQALEQVKLAQQQASQLAASNPPGKP